MASQKDNLTLSEVRDKSHRILREEAFRKTTRAKLKEQQGGDVFGAAAAKSLQSCPTLGDPIDGSPPGSPVSGILQARTLEWIAISFSNA